jgi:hypothetical protein
MQFYTEWPGKPSETVPCKRRPEKVGEQGIGYLEEVIRQRKEP